MSAEDERLAARRELDEINKKYRDSFVHMEEEAKSELGQEIVKLAIVWGEENPDDLEYMLTLAKGVERLAFDYSLPNPLFYEALGRIGKPETIPWLKDTIASCIKQRLCFYLEEMFGALLQIDDIESQKAIESLLRKPKRNRLVIAFVNALKENPKPDYIATVVKLAEAGHTYRLDTILVRMVRESEVSLLPLLTNKKRQVKETALMALRILSHEYYNDDIIHQLKLIVENEREHIFNRYQSAEILKELEIEVPTRFRDRPKSNTSDNLPRLINGILHPEVRDETWADEEIVLVPLVRSTEDKIRFDFRFALASLFVDVRIWQGYFWDVFHMGVTFRRKFWPRNKYKIVGLTRATRFESDWFAEDFLQSNLDTILTRILIDHMNARGDVYQRYIRTINKAVREGGELVIRGTPTWELDEEKLMSQGGR